MPEPREVFTRMQQTWLSGGTIDAALLAEDVVVEVPFAPSGRPQRFVGRDQFLAFANAGRAALPVRFDNCRQIAIHQTSDPDVLVVEYELRGTFTTTGQPGAATFIAVLRIRNGQITLWREYQNTLALAAALGQLPQPQASN
jgi:ketosteroid isomerase-like protein